MSITSIQAIKIITTAVGEHVLAELKKRDERIETLEARLAKLESERERDIERRISALEAAQ